MKRNKRKKLYSLGVKRPNTLKEIKRVANISFNTVYKLCFDALYDEWYAHPFTKEYLKVAGTNSVVATMAHLYTKAEDWTRFILH